MTSNKEETLTCDKKSSGNSLQHRTEWNFIMCLSLTVSVLEQYTHIYNREHRTLECSDSTGVVKYTSVLGTLQYKCFHTPTLFFGGGEGGGFWVHQLDMI